ncbi:MAG: UvrD-helicase domain-containing protein [Candidatus Rhabdochlamydia sp.]
MLMHLNPEQQQAVYHIEGPALIIAGAGSGKTRVVTHRISHLIEKGVPSDEILAVTFTNKAAGEMRKRVQESSNHLVLTCTFHSLGAKILRESISHLGYDADFTIYDEDDSEKCLKECLISLNLQGDKALLKNFRSQISACKNGLLSPEDLAKEDSTAGAVYALYQNHLKSANSADFDDLLYLPIQLFKEHPDVLALYQKRWSFILIDEYQDTNHAQHALIKLLSAHHKNVFAVGDPDQSIYSWRGANVDNILNFEEDFPGSIIIALEQNYRSPSTILSAANALISHNPAHYDKKLWSTLGKGPNVGIYTAQSDHQEAEFVAQKVAEYQTKFSLDDCVVFYRTHSQSRVLEDTFLKKRIPYVIVGGLSFYQRREIKDILALLRMSLKGNDFIAFSRTVNIPKRGLGEKTLQKIRDAAVMTNTPLMVYCQKLIQGDTDLSISARQLQGLKEYTEMMTSLNQMVRDNISLHTLVKEVIERSRYEIYLKEDPETMVERQENINEFLIKSAEWELENPGQTLADFLEELTLKSSMDEAKDDGYSLRLMTLHNSKGLEFPVVFLVGMEEEIFPHINSLGSETAIQEERRLCYVGMTRAKASLYLSCSRTRFLWGGAKMMRPSRFLSEIPSEYTRDLSPRSYTRDSSGSEDLLRGDEVIHKDFGRGIIQKSYQTSLGLTYDVFFPNTQKMYSLIAKYAKLVKSEESDFY